MEGVYSHPTSKSGEPIQLRTHLEQVRNLAKDRVIPDDATIFSDTSVQDVCGRIALVHDLGKATTWFQQHIGMVEGEPTGPTHHAALGAFVAYYVLRKLGYESEVALAGFVAVAKHHQSLPNVAEFVYNKTDTGPVRGSGRNNSSDTELQQVVNNIDANAQSLANQIIQTASDGNGAWSDFTDTIRNNNLPEEIQGCVSRRGFKPDNEELSDDFYDSVLQLWSCLCLADKFTAAEVPQSALGGTKPGADILSSYIDGLSAELTSHSGREQRLNEYRSQARGDITKNARAFANSSSNFATLTLPTGLGKTLSGLEAAVTIRDLGDRSNIVYALPFTSIIEQVSSEIQDIYNTDGTDDLLTVHHHLADTVTDVDDENTDETAAIETLVGESWRSGMTITTYVQLFESLAGPRNSQSLKLPSLYRSVIILDEPQSIPHDWWPLLRRLFRLLIEDYDAVIIAMTATQPRFFSENADTTELVDQPEQYFEDITRVQYSFDESVQGVTGGDVEPITHSEAMNRMRSDIEQDESVLCVCNTIDSARQLTEIARNTIDYISIGEVLEAELSAQYNIDSTTLAEIVADRSEPHIGLHLSTRLRPRDRLTCIKAASKLLAQGESLLTISTQLIEAGVDISFENVYRDLAPIDSIIQAGGRCNRSFEQDSGSVTVWRLEPPNEKRLPPSDAVYNRAGESLLNITWKALQAVQETEIDSVSEYRASWQAVEEYYRILREERHAGNSEYVSYVNNAQAVDLQGLSLIDKRQAVDVIVTRSPEEADELDEIETLWNQRDYDKLNERLDAYRDRRISVPIYDSTSTEAQRISNLERIHPDSQVRILNAHSGKKTFFDATTGLVIPDGVEHRFL